MEERIPLLLVVLRNNSFSTSLVVVVLFQRRTIIISSGGGNATAHHHDGDSRQGCLRIGRMMTGYYIIYCSHPSKRQHGSCLFDRTTRAVDDIFVSDEMSFDFLMRRTGLPPRPSSDRLAPDHIYEYIYIYCTYICVVVAHDGSKRRVVLPSNFAARPNSPSSSYRGYVHLLEGTEHRRTRHTSHHSSQ